MKYTVGSVPYLNAKPLVKPLEWRGETSPVQVEYDVPSRLPEMLAARHAAAILVSSYYTIVNPGLRIADNLSISSQNEVLSVRLFSKVPFQKIRTLALDASSMTSNALALIVLRDRHSVDPNAEPQKPCLASMLEEHDACVLIGDNGMRAEDAGLRVLDLGSEWRALTGLPFVWAVWAGNTALGPELVAYLQASLSESRNAMPRVIEDAVRDTGFTESECRHYLLEIMDYRLDQDHLVGLAEFARRIQSHRLAAVTWMPEVVPAGAPLLKSGV